MDILIKITRLIEKQIEMDRIMSENYKETGSTQWRLHRRVEELEKRVKMLEEGDRQFTQEEWNKELVELWKKGVLWAVDEHGQTLRPKVEKK
jgi:transcription termination factor Rho